MYTLYPEKIDDYRPENHYSNRLLREMEHIAVDSHSLSLGEHLPWEKYLMYAKILKIFFPSQFPKPEINEEMGSINHKIRDTNAPPSERYDIVYYLATTVPDKLPKFIFTDPDFDFRESAIGNLKNPEALLMLSQFKSRLKAVRPYKGETVSKEIWTAYKKSHKYWAEQEKWLEYIRMSTHLHILAAEDIEHTENGINIIMPQPLPESEAPAIPIDKQL